MSRFSKNIKLPVSLIMQGGVIAYPTEGVFGLGCDPFNADAVGRILEIKKRPVHKGLILIAHSIEIFRPFLAELTSFQEQTLMDSWPGAVTWVAPHNGSLPSWITGGRPTIAIRVTSHPIASALCQEAGIPLVSTSANRHKRPAIETQLQVQAQLGPQLDYVVSGRVLTPGKTSKIKDLISGAAYRI